MTDQLVDAKGVAQNINNALKGELNLNDGVRTEEAEILFTLEPEQISLLRDVVTETASATVGYNGTDTIEITTDGAQSASRGVDETSEIIDYTSGLVAEGGLGVQPETQPAGFMRWGLGQETLNDAAFFEYDSNGDMYAEVRRGGVGTRVPASGWSNTELRAVQNENSNVDFYVVGFDNVANDGMLTDPIDPTRGYRYNIDYIWYGYGPIVFFITYLTDNGAYKRTPLVAFIPFKNTSITETNLPVFAENNNNGTAASTTLHVGGRQGARVGKRTLKGRPTRHIIQNPPSIPSGSYTTIALLKKKAGFQGVPIDIRSVNVIGNPIYDIAIIGRVTPASSTSYSNPNNPASETSLFEVDEGTAIATQNGNFTGEVAGAGPTEAGTGTGGNAVSSQSNIESKRGALIRDFDAGIVARDITGGGTTPDEIQIVLETTY